MTASATPHWFRHLTPNAIKRVWFVLNSCKISLTTAVLLCVK